jgi:hypothetical protein
VRARAHGTTGNGFTDPHLPSEKYLEEHEIHDLWADGLKGLMSVAVWIFVQGVGQLLDRPGHGGKREQEY